ncbi:FHIPEP family type III secretion protein [Pseudomonas sp. TH10]|uniref:FHIPEP family type III secretion protein n=1 Tax=Pseudomonas sp. TH10 TaxID=2796376 RepID=UPI0035A833EE
MFDKILRSVTSRPELLILTLMVMIIAMLIIPLPTVLVDFLIGLNIVIAILIFMGSFYIERILSFSTFPALLLITTLFRLALSISTSRLILTQADAGEIIASFGEFVIGDSLVVGFVIFSIVTIVQFIVITKGSGAGRRGGGTFLARWYARQADEHRRRPQGRLDRHQGSPRATQYAGA